MCQCNMDHVFECNEIEALFQRFAHLRSLVCPLLGGCQSASALTTVILPSKDFQWERGEGANCGALCYSRSRALVTAYTSN